MKTTGPCNITDYIYYIHHSRGSVRSITVKVSYEDRGSPLFISKLINQYNLHSLLWGQLFYNSHGPLPRYTQGSDVSLMYFSLLVCADSAKHFLGSLSWARLNIVFNIHHHRRKLFLRHSWPSLHVYTFIFWLFSHAVSCRVL